VPAFKPVGLVELVVVPDVADELAGELDRAVPPADEAGLDPVLEVALPARLAEVEAPVAVLPVVELELPAARPGWSNRS